MDATRRHSLSVQLSWIAIACLWTAAAAAISVLVPTLVKVAHGAWTGDDEILLYGFRMRNDEIDIVHVTAGFLCWETILLVILILRFVWRHPPRKVRRWRDTFWRRRKEDERIDQEIVNVAGNNFQIGDDDSVDIGGLEYITREEEVPVLSAQEKKD